MGRGRKPPFIEHRLCQALGLWLRALFMGIHLFRTPPPSGRNHGPYFTDIETEAQSGEGTFPKPKGEPLIEQDSNPHPRAMLPQSSRNVGLNLLKLHVLWVFSLPGEGRWLRLGDL